MADGISVKWSEQGDIVRVWKNVDGKTVWSFDVFDGKPQNLELYDKGCLVDPGELLKEFAQYPGQAPLFRMPGQRPGLQKKSQP